MAFRNYDQQTFAYKNEWQNEVNTENVHLSKELARLKTELCQIKLELGKVNHVLDAFVYSISHTIRQPLTSILGLIHLARHDHVSSRDESALYHQMMETSIQKLDGTLKEIQDYSESSRKAIEIKNVDLERFIELRYDQLILTQGLTGISKGFHIDHQYPFYTDPHLFFLIITNVLSNAIKFRDDNKENQFIKIIVSVRQDFCNINITDNGIGIDPTYLPRVFEMFFKANNIKEGAGLGLAIVDQAVSKLSGSISISSRIGEGTEVSIQLPNELDRFMETDKIHNAMKK